MKKDLTGIEIGDYVELCGPIALLKGLIPHSQALERLGFDRDGINFNAGVMGNQYVEVTGTPPGTLIDGNLWYVVSILLQAEENGKYDTSLRLYVTPSLIVHWWKKDEFNKDLLENCIVIKGKSDDIESKVPSKVPPQTAPIETTGVHFISGDTFKAPGKIASPESGFKDRKDRLKMFAIEKAIEITGTNDMEQIKEQAKQIYEWLRK